MDDKPLTATEALEQEREFFRNADYTAWHNFVDSIFGPIISRTNDILKDNIDNKLKITVTDENGDFIRNDHGAEKL